MSVLRTEFKVPPLTTKERIRYYCNLAIAILGFAGYFGPHLSPLFVLLTIFALWYTVAWAIALIQLTIGTMWLVQGKDPKGTHHILSAVGVGILYALGFAMINGGMILTA